MLTRGAGLGWPEAFEHMNQEVRLAADVGVADGDLDMERQRFCGRSKLYLLQCNASGIPGKKKPAGESGLYLFCSRRIEETKA